MCKKRCDAESGFILRCWDHDEKDVVTKYFTSLFFARTKAASVTKKILDFHDNNMFNCGIIFAIFREININKVIWRELDGGLKERGYKGLIEFINCTLHVMHNGFRKGTTAKGGLGERIKQLAFNLHAWLNVVIIFMFFRINSMKKFVKIGILCFKTYIKTCNVSRHMTRIVRRKASTM